MLRELVTAISTRFSVTDIGVSKRLLGMTMSIDQESTKLGQSAYIEEILIKFNMENCKIAKSSQPGYCLSASMSPTNEYQKTEMASVPYRELVGALNWLATSTRSDIAHAVSCLSRFLNNPVSDKKAKSVIFVPA
jgi:hypothetical protein